MNRTITEIMEAYTELYVVPLYYEDELDKLIYRNALKDLMNKLRLLPKRGIGLRGKDEKN